MGKPDYTFLDLFAGAGGLSEGFVRAGFVPIAHVEMDQAACFTLRTRQAYHWLSQNGLSSVYDSYLSGTISRQELYDFVPTNVLKRVINEEISLKTLPRIFAEIDSLQKGRNVDLIIGGPPCQAYSLVGRARDENGMKSDERNFLYRMYARFLEKYKPRYFVFENVVGLLSAKNEYGNRYLDVMRRLFRSKGYSTGFKVLDARDYGVPQSRKRVILIGKRLEKGQRANMDFYPEIKRLISSSCTVNELFEDLAPLQAGEGSYFCSRRVRGANKYLYEARIIEEDSEEVSFHISRANKDTDLKIYRLAVELWNRSRIRLKYNELSDELSKHNNKSSFLDRFKVVDGESLFSHTVVAHIHKDGHYYIHPDIKQNRSLTPREVARLQTFPDNYFFESITGKPSITYAYKQIGNAVPVLLAECIANSLKDRL